MINNREYTYLDLRKKMESAGFIFEKEQKPHLQNARIKELKFVHPKLQRKFENHKLNSRAKKYYIKPLSDDKDSEIGLTTGKTSLLYNIELFPQANAIDTYQNPNNKINAWVNRFNENVLDKLLDAIGKYLIPTIDDIYNKLSYELLESNKLSSEQRLKKIQQSNKKPESMVVTTTAFKRNPNVVAEVLFQSKGKCGSCFEDAPFNRKSDGTPYLEVHHKVTLSQGGDDTVENAIALCPNCHRKQHFG